MATTPGGKRKQSLYFDDDVLAFFKERQKRTGAPVAVLARLAMRQFMEREQTAPATGQQAAERGTAA